jgi:transcriptional regulator with XRE-family HTH domain
MIGHMKNGQLAKQVVGSNICRLRNGLGLSQIELSESVGIFRTFMSRIETGNANPSLTTLVALAVALHVGVDELFEGIGQKDYLCAECHAKGAVLTSL